MMFQKWWKKEALKFECQPDCFKCCCKPGVVYFDKDDVKRAAEFLDLSEQKFKQTFLKKEGHYWMLEVEENSACLFLTPDGCNIHPAKPKQCRTYPFWPEVMETKNNWELTSAFCPGMNKGPVIPTETINHLLKNHTDWW
jgi:uncharacterized protein